MALNIERMYQCLRNFNFAHLLVEELGWSSPVNVRLTPIDSRHHRLEIARLSGIPVFEIDTADGEFPDAQMRDMLYKEIMPLFRESLLIFLNKERTQSLWYWRKHEGNATYKREYVYIQGQPEDLFFNKLDSIVLDLLPPQDQRKRKNDRLRPVSNVIVEAFDAQRMQFIQQIEGIEKERDRELYAMILLCRLMFLYFLQCRGFLNINDMTYLERHLKRSDERNYYREFLLPLFDALSNPLFARREDSQENLGVIPYLGGGLFSPHRIEQQYSTIQIRNEAFSQIFTFFSRYAWQMVDISSQSEEEITSDNPSDNIITPDILGNIFEIYFNHQSQNSAYATPPEITEYFCKQTIQQSILDKMRQVSGYRQYRSFMSFQEFLDDLDNLKAEQCRNLLFEILPHLSILDPACGSGTFLLGALNTLLLVYSKLIIKAADLHDSQLSDWVSTLHVYHPDRMYSLKKRIITQNLFGVDIVDEAVELTRLRLYLALISSLEGIENLEPLPDIDFNLYVGDSLIGFLHLDDMLPTVENSLFSVYIQEYSELVATYREIPRYGDDLYSQKVGIAQKQTEAVTLLNNVLLEQLQQLQRRYGSRVARRLHSQSGEQATIADIKHLRPFYWCYEFDQIMNRRGGFDIIITSPPWEIPRSGDPSTNYYQHLFYEYAPQYTHQASIQKNRARQASTNLYKLFLEQCYNLLRIDGYCSMVVPRGICTDESAGKLRQLLFTQTRVTGLFCFENRREIWPGIDPRFEFTLVSFKKGQETKILPFAFSSQVIEDLEHFPEQSAIDISVDFIRRFSPHSLAVGKFKDQRDISISEKMMAFSPLNVMVDGIWNLTLNPGIFLNLRNQILLTEPKGGALPIYEGKTIDQFTYLSAYPRYWVDRGVFVQDTQQRFATLARAIKRWQQPEGHGYHLVFRSVTSSTNSRTMIATILPPNTLINNTLNFVSSPLNAEELLFLTALLNSFIVDFAIRLRVATYLSLSAVYHTPIPRLTKQDEHFRKIVARAAQLICISEDFKELWESAMQEPWSQNAAATNPAERNRLRAELDGLIAQIYNITEADFVYILSTFSLVSAPTKVAARNAYRDMERGLLS